MTETLVHTVAFPHLNLEQVVDQVDCWEDRRNRKKTDWFKWGKNYIVNSI